VTQGGGEVLGEIGTSGAGPEGGAAADEAVLVCFTDPVAAAVCAVVTLVVAIPVITCSAEDSNSGISITEAENGDGICVQEIESW